MEDPFSEDCLEEYEHGGVPVKINCNGLLNLEKNVTVQYLLVLA